MKFLSVHRFLLKRPSQPIRRAVRWRRGGGKSTCRYCLGHFRPKKTWGVYCSNACRKAAWVAVHAEELDPISLRRETWSSDRAAATGYGSMTRRASFNRDLYLRQKAGIFTW